MTLTRPAAWADLALGAWLLAAPSVIGYQAARPVTVFEDLIPGIFLCITSALVLFVRLRPLRTEWLQALCGLWLLAGSVVLIVRQLPGAALNGMLVGVAVLGLSLAVWFVDRPSWGKTGMHVHRPS